MVIPRPKHSRFHFRQTAFLLIIGIVLLQSCSHNKNVYKSNCDVDIVFKHTTFKQIMDSLADYDHQYVEVSGEYKEDKERSALVSDSLLTDHSNKNALWVNFSQDCPLYLSGTHTGLFEYSNDGFTPMKNKVITIRGKINLNNKGYLKQYKGSIERVSLIRL